jgi:hypothetical protein
MLLPLPQAVLLELLLMPLLCWVLPVVMASAAVWLLLLLLTQPLMVTHSK